MGIAAATTIGLPAWATYGLIGDHPPDLATGLCSRCPHGAIYPCPFARAHFADLARETPVSGWVWLRWYASQTATTAAGGQHGDVVWAATVGWYERAVRRVEAYVGNRGRRWRMHG